MYALLMVLCLCLTPGVNAESESVYQHFTTFFASNQYNAPEAVQVLGVRVDSGHLTVNVCGKIMEYGGNANERMLIEQLLCAASAVDGVRYFSLLVEGELIPLPEGRVIDKLMVPS